MTIMIIIFVCSSPTLSLETPSSNPSSCEMSSEVIKKLCVEKNWIFQNTSTEHNIVKDDSEVKKGILFSVIDND